MGRNAVPDVAYRHPALDSLALGRIVDTPLYAGTAEHKRTFCMALAQYGNITRAAMAIDVGRQTIWRWRNEDSAFDATITAILQAFAEERQDRLEETLDKLALVDENLLAIFFRLKRLDASYKDNYQPPVVTTARQALRFMHDDERDSAIAGEYSTVPALPAPDAITE